ncbi:MAG: hypothetical protein PVG39_02800 [Desulfobacteraceae bacterium]
MTSKRLMKKYNCDIFKDSGGKDDSRRFWVAIGNEGSSFQYAEGSTLSELEEEIKDCIE